MKGGLTSLSSLFNNMKYDKWQEEFLKTEGDKLLCTGRQVGKSTVCSVDAAEWALKNPDKTILMIAPVERQAYELFEKTVLYLIEHYPKRIITKGAKRPTKTRCYLTNKTRILCLPAGTSGIGIRGYTIHRLYADEAARIPEEVYTAVTPMLLTTAGDIILLSTPWGKQGYFWETYEKDKNFTIFHENSENVIKNREISESWTEPQRIKALEFLNKEKERKTKLQYGQEYLGLFVDDLMRLFSDELLDKTLKAVKRPPDKTKKSYLGVDIARMGGDETVFAIIEKETKEKLIQIENIIALDNRITDTVREILHLNRKFNFRRIYIDSAGMGVGVFDPLIEHPETKRKVKAIENARRSIEYDPEKPKEKRILKEDLYNNLINLMEQDKIVLLDDPEIRQSLKSIQIEYTEKGNLRIFGRYDHIAEAIIRAAWCIKDKSLNSFIF